MQLRELVGMLPRCEARGVAKRRKWAFGRQCESKAAYRVTDKEGVEFCLCGQHFNKLRRSLSAKAWAKWEKLNP